MAHMKLYIEGLFGNALMSGQMLRSGHSGFVVLGCIP